ncbi:hypothetical protein D9M68_403460 [compost metagenome]
MNLPEIPPNASRQELRKALLRLRLEMHRQEIRHESQQLLQPLRKVRNFSSGLPNAPLWGIAALSALGFLAGKRQGLRRLIRIGTLLYPVLMVALRRPATPAGEQPPSRP